MARAVAHPGAGAALSHATEIPARIDAAIAAIHDVAWRELSRERQELLGVERAAIDELDLLDSLASALLPTDEVDASQPDYERFRRARDRMRDLVARVCREIFQMLAGSSAEGSAALLDSFATRVVEAPKLRDVIVTLVTKRCVERVGWSATVQALTGVAPAPGRKGGDLPGGFLNNPYALARALAIVTGAVQVFAEEAGSTQGDTAIPTDEQRARGGGSMSGAGAARPHLSHDELSALARPERENRTVVAQHPGWVEHVIFCDVCADALRRLRRAARAEPAPARRTVPAEVVEELTAWLSTLAQSESYATGPLRTSVEVVWDALNRVVQVIARGGESFPSALAERRLLWSYAPRFFLASASVEDASEKIDDDVDVWGQADVALPSPPSATQPSHSPAESSPDPLRLLAEPPLEPPDQEVVWTLDALKARVVARAAPPTHEQRAAWRTRSGQPGVFRPGTRFVIYWGDEGTPLRGSSIPGDHLLAAREWMEHDEELARWLRELVDFLERSEPTERDEEVARIACRLTGAPKWTLKLRVDGITYGPVTTDEWGWADLVDLPFDPEILKDRLRCDVYVSPAEPMEAR